MNYRGLTDMELCQLLKREDRGAWNHVLQVLVAQEKFSAANNRKRFDWNVPLESLLGQLYEEMVGQRKLECYEGRGSLIGWLRTYLRGYLNRQNPERSRFVSMDEAPQGEEDEASGPTLAEKIAFEKSEPHGGDAYVDEDLHVLRHEQWEIAQKCFRDLWQGNTMQAYVMLLKLRFHMSSLEIKERLGVTSAANVDQMFARAVKKMKEVKVKYAR